MNSPVVLFILKIFNKLIVKQNGIPNIAWFRATGRTHSAFVQYILCNPLKKTCMSDIEKLYTESILLQQPLPGIFLINWRKGVVCFPSYVNVCRIALGH